MVASGVGQSRLEIVVFSGADVVLVSCRWESPMKVVFGQYIKACVCNTVRPILTPCCPLCMDLDDISIQLCYSCCFCDCVFPGVILSNRVVLPVERALSASGTSSCLFCPLHLLYFIGPCCIRPLSVQSSPFAPFGSQYLIIACIGVLSVICDVPAALYVQ